MAGEAAKDDDKEVKQGTEQKEGEASNAKGSDETGGGDNDSGGSLRSYIEDVVRAVVGSSSDSSAADDAKPPARRTVAGAESDIAALVRQEQAKLMKELEKETADKRRDEEISALKKATERPPSRQGIGGRLQRFMWGE